MSITGVPDTLSAEKVELLFRNIPDEDIGNRPMVMDFEANRCLLDETTGDTPGAKFIRGRFLEIVASYGASIKKVRGDGNCFPTACAVSFLYNMAEDPFLKERFLDLINQYVTDDWVRYMQACFSKVSRQNPNPYKWMEGRQIFTRDELRQSLRDINSERDVQECLRDNPLMLSLSFYIRILGRCLAETKGIQSLFDVTEEDLRRETPQDTKNRLENRQNILDEMIPPELGAEIDMQICSTISNELGLRFRGFNIDPRGIAERESKNYADDGYPHVIIILKEGHYYAAWPDPAHRASGREVVPHLQQQPERQQQRLYLQEQYQEVEVLPMILQK